MNKLLLISVISLVAWLYQPAAGINQPVALKAGGDSLEISFNKVVSYNAEPPGDRLCITLNQKVCDTCFKARVHTRWGDIMWETNDVTKCWAGNSPTDSIVPSGVYYVKVTAWFNGKIHSHVGHTTFIRKI